MHKFQYYILFFTIEELNDIDSTQNKLNMYGSEGWEITSQTPNKDGLYLILKRIC